MTKAKQIDGVEQLQGFQLWIKRQPLLTFFIFAFLISWSTWLVAPTISDGDMSLQTLIDLAGAFGPALSAILVSFLLDKKPSRISGKKRFIVFSVVFAVTLILLLYAYMFLYGVYNFSLVLASIINSILAAYVISSVFHPRIGVVNLMAGLKLTSKGYPWIIVGFVLPFAFHLLGGVVLWMLGGNDLFKLTSDTLVIVLINYPFTLMFGGPLNEEPGWRGFAIPNMKYKNNALVTGLIIGTFWSFWHLPLYATGFNGGGFEGFLLRFTWNVPLGVLMTWLFNRSGGNLLACIFMHTSFNDSTQIFASSTIQQIAILLMIVFTGSVVLYDNLFRRRGLQ